MNSNKIFSFPKPKWDLPFTGERFTSEAKGEIAHEHYHRYLFALQFCENKRVLDIACGEGFGSGLLSCVAEKVIGIDISKEAVVHARKNYQRANLTYAIGDCAHIPIPDCAVDVALSFETIEHIADHAAFLTELKRILVPGGLLVMSSPDREIYSAPGTEPNVFHIKELSKSEFDEMLQNKFKHLKLLGQKAIIGSAILPDKEPGPSANETFEHLEGPFYRSCEGVAKAAYIVAVASDAELPVIRAGILDDRAFLLNLYDDHQRFHDDAIREKDRADRLETQTIRLQADLLALKEQAAIHKVRASALEGELRTTLAAKMVEKDRSDRLEARTIQLHAECVEFQEQIKTHKAELQRMSLLEDQLQKSHAEINALLELLHNREQAREHLHNELQIVGERIGRLEESVRKRRPALPRMLAKMKNTRGLIRKVHHIPPFMLKLLLNTMLHGEPQKGLKEVREWLLIRESGLFSPDFYRAQYPDVVAVGVDPVLHFLRFGALEKRNPHPLFDTAFYLEKNADVDFSGINPVIHFLLHGAKKKRNPHPLFDISFYLEQHKDVAESGVNPLSHFISYGGKEKRSPHPLFDSRYYLEKYPEVTAAGANPLSHYVLHGGKEGRSPHPHFDVSSYLKKNPDLQRSGVNPLVHYLRSTDRAHGYQHAPAPLNSGMVTQDALSTTTGMRVLDPSHTYAPALAVNHEFLDLATPPTRNASRSNLRARHNLASTASKPKISILMPTYNTPARYLKLAVESVQNQIYPNWELLIQDDGSTNADTHAALDALATDERIRIERSRENQGISAATNSALQRATGDWVAMLDHDDEFTPDALLEVVKAIGSDSSADAVYTDQDYVNEDGSFSRSFFKPDWSPELFRGVMYVGHLLVVRRNLANEVGGFDSRFDNVQDFEFMLRISERTDRILHVPKVLYHWRMIPGSVAFHGDEKTGIEFKQMTAVNAHLKRLSLTAVAESNTRHAHRLLILPAPRKSDPRITVFIWGQDAQRTVDSILGQTQYPGLKLIVINDEKGRRKIRAEATPGGTPDLRIEDALINEPSEYYAIVGGGLEVRTRDWVEHLLLYCERPDIACVSPLILRSDGTVANAGVVIGMDNTVGACMAGWDPSSDGYAGSLSCAREVSAVTGFCLMISQKSLARLGGLHPDLSCAVKGIELSLRAARTGMHNILTPRAVFQWPSESPAMIESGLDTLLLEEIHGRMAALPDPYYNPNFSKVSPGYV